MNTNKVTSEDSDPKSKKPSKKQDQAKKGPKSPKKLYVHYQVYLSDYT